ncbi:MAG TPA: oligoendopeptidase F, partial [Symbiobacteriaceae bacterium]|nr:oligoendopeptidase F [Symbiobacteriaceae bacterium]
MQRLKRSDVPVEQTWDLTDLFGDRAAWEAELEAIGRDLSTVTDYKGKLAQGPAMLAACLDAQEELHKRLLRVSAYANFRFSADGTEPAYQADNARFGALWARVAAATTFIKSEALALPLEEWIAADPAVAGHRFTLRNWLEMKPHTLLPETEAALAGLSEVLDAPGRIYNLSKGADMKFAPALDAEGQAHPVYEGGPQLSPDPVLRRNAYAAFTRG